MGIFNRFLNKAQQMALGAAGTTFIDDTAENTGDWWVVVPIEDTVFTTLTDSTRDGDALGSNTFPAGIFIPGHITTIKLASGAVLAYKRPLIAGE